MVDKAHRRMIDGVNKMSGRANCSDAVMLQQRNRLVVGVLFVAFVVVMTAFSVAVEPSSIVATGIACIVVTAGMLRITTTYWLGFCDGELVLVKTNRLRNKATELIAQYSYPTPATVESGLITKKVTVADVEYLMHRQAEERFRSITGS